MKFLLPAACVTALAAGLVATPEESNGSWLVDLHVHGSLSEGVGSMTNHAQQAAVWGFDGLWFADHMTRVLGEFLPLSVPFEGSLESPVVLPPSSTPTFRADVEGDDSDILEMEYRSDDPRQGQQYLRVTADSANVFSFGRKTARLAFRGYERGHREGLLSDPLVGTWVRYRGHTGDSGFLLRIKLTGTPNGSTREGAQRALEFLPANFANSSPPPRTPGTTRVIARSLPLNQWVNAKVRLGDLIGGPPVLEEDMSIIDVSIEFWGRWFDEVTVDLDDFRILREGPSGAALFAEQAQWLDQNPVPGLFQHVGAEIEGPLDQAILGTSSRDHLVALFPTTTSSDIAFPPGSPNALGYPASGVQAIQALGGVAVLAHIFGSDQDHNNTGYVIPASTAQVLADRVVNSAGWGADAIEVGYPRRGRVLEEFVDVWDRLSADGVFMTGVAASDNHDLEPWEQRRNRWGTWILAPTASKPDLCDAVRSGRAFFGDPYRFDPDGEFELREAGGAFVAGNVVSTSPGSENFRVELSGAESGSDEVVLLHNGVEVARKSVSGNGSVSFTESVQVAAGDWVRAELRDNQDKAYAFTNPVYFIGPGSSPPPHRAP